MNRVLKAVAAPGRMALSWYLLHIVVGLGAIVVLGWEQSCPVALAMALGTLFWIAAVGISAIYLRRFKTGPAETVLRSLAG
jgi:uncharacterized membrane protein YeiB